MFGSGCFAVKVKPARAGAKSGGSSGSDDCPPGKRWSDGKCHDKGKGHDPDKKRGKSEDKRQDKENKGKGKDKKKDKDD